MSGDDWVTLDTQAVDDFARRPAGDARNPTPWWEAAAANWRLGNDDDPAHNLGYLITAYNDAADELIRRGKPAARYRRAGSLLLGGKPDVPHDLWPVLWHDVVEARRADPTAFTDYPDEQDAFEKWARGRKGARLRDQMAAAAGGFGSQLLPGLAMGLRDSAQPENLPWLLTGGEAGSIAQLILRQGLAGMQQQAAGTADVVRSRAAMGEGYSPEQLAADLGMAGAAQGVLAGAHMAAPKVAQFAGDLVPLDVRVARALGKADPAEVTDLDVAQAFDAAFPAHARTPDEQAALHVATREGEIAASSPYADTHAGLALHRQRLEEAGERLIDPAAPRRARSGGNLDGAILAGLRARGFPEHQVRGIAAGIHAESASNPRAVNPSSGALGIGQWLGPRKRAIIERYGPNPTLDQQLDFLAEELRGRDPGGRKVLAQGDEAAVLRSYIEDFMRPKKGRETDRDLARGMAALGRGEEDLPALARGDDGIDGELGDALAAERADIEMQRMRLDTEGLAPVEHDIELPELRREAFAGESDWRVAQAASDAEVLGLPAPVATRESTAIERLAAERPAAEQAQPITVGEAVTGQLNHIAGERARYQQLEAQRAKLSRGPEDELPFAPGPYRRAANALGLHPQSVAEIRARLDELDEMEISAPADMARGVAVATGRRLADVPDDWVVRDAAGQEVARGAVRPEMARIARRTPGAKLTRELGAQSAPLTPAEAVARAEIDRLGSDDRFADPIGPELQLQSERLGHDMKQLIETEDPRRFRLDDGREGTVAELFEALGEEDKAIAAVRGCL